MKADLHVHTHFSPCSKAVIGDVLKKAQSRGLDAIAITDHNTITGALLAKKANPYPDLEVIIGCEKKCEYGELLIYNLKKEIISSKFADIVKEARKQKALIFIAHPFDAFRFTTKWRNFSDKVMKSVDGFEILNGRNVFNRKSVNLYNRSLMRCVAGSDSHFVEEIGNTFVEYDKDLWKEVMKRTATFHSNNSFFRKLGYLIKSFATKWIFR